MPPLPCNPQNTAFHFYLELKDTNKYISYAVIKSQRHTRMQPECDSQGETKAGLK